MITLNHLLKRAILLGFLVCCIPNVNAQFIDNLIKKAEKASKKEIEKAIEKKAEKETEKAMDSILNPKKKSKKRKKSKAIISSEGNTGRKKETTSDKEITDITTDPIQINRKFNFVPGDKILFQDDFSKEFEGDLPKNWNTNGGGSIVTLGNSSERWFEITSGKNIFYIPDVLLPQEYTVEFDLTIIGIDKLSILAYFNVIFSNNNKFGLSYAQYGNKKENPYAYFRLPISEANDLGISIENSHEIKSKIDLNLKKIKFDNLHVSIAVNKKRFRIWLNDHKFVDIPRFIEEADELKYLKFNLSSLAKAQVLIKDLKVAEGGVDLRQQLLNKGTYTSSGILFSSGSATLKLQSYGVIKQVSQVLQRDTTMKLKITGHTDADGSEAENLALSKARANAVKATLVEVYGIAEDRLITDGKGEVTPVADNTSNKGKAQNRRVEFTSY